MGKEHEHKWKAATCVASADGKRLEFEPPVIIKGNSLSIIMLVAAKGAPFVAQGIDSLECGGEDEHVVLPLGAIYLPDTWKGDIFTDTSTVKDEKGKVLERKDAIAYYSSSWAFYGRLHYALA